MRTIAALALSACLAAGCGDDATTPTSPSTDTATDTTVTFIGSLAPGGSRFYSFTLAAAGTVSVMLASVTSPSNGRPVARALEIAVGVPAGTGCTPTTSQTALPSLTSQLTASLQAGTYCVRVADTSGQADPIDFALRFTHP